MGDSLVIRKRPLVPVAVLLIGGIVWARLNPGSTAFAWWLFAMAAPLLIFPPARTLGIALTLIALGILLYSARYRIPSESDLRLVIRSEPELVTVRGRITEAPSQRNFASGTNNTIYTHCIIEAAQIQRAHQWEPATGFIATRTRGALTPDFFAGGEVEVTGVIELPPQAAAPGLFDYRAYLHNLRIFHQLKSDSTNDWRLVAAGTMPLTERFRRWGQNQLQRGLPAEDEAVRTIFAMTLGMKQTLSGEASEPFIRTGTMHIIAVSGLHVMCIAGLFLYLLQVVGFSRGTCGMIAVPAVWFYVLATGWQSSAIRAGLMFSVIVASRLLKRPTDLLNSTATAAVIILLFQPEQLFQAGFQLSFVVVASLALFTPALQRFKPGWISADPFLPRTLWPRWRVLAEPGVRFAKAMIVVTVASWLGSLPLTAYYFNIVTVSSFFANLVAVPLSSVALAATSLSLAVPFAAPVFNYFGWAFMTHTLTFTKWCAEMPFGFFYVPKPNAWFFAFYFAAMLFAFVPGWRAPGRRVWSIAVVLSFAAAWIGSVMVGRPIATLTLLPCGGTPALVQERGREAVLIDCSSERDAEFVLERYLHAQGLGSVKNLFLTHGDAQNVGGFTRIWTEFNPARVFTAEARARSPIYRHALATLEQAAGRWKTVARDSHGARWEVLHPGAGKGFPRADDNALVLRRTIGGWRVLHLSDLGAAGQKQLLESASDLRADVVIAGMPERDAPLGKQLLAAIQPQVIILGTTRYPYTSEGTPELRARLEESGAEVFYTTESDAIIIELRRERCTVKGMNGAGVVLEK